MTHHNNLSSTLVIIYLIPLGFNSLKNLTPILYLVDSMANQANESVEWLISSAGMIFVVSMEVHLFIPAYHLIHIAVLVHKR